MTHGSKKNPQKAWPSGAISRKLGRKSILVRAVSTQSTSVHCFTSDTSFHIGGRPFLGECVAEG